MRRTLFTTLAIVALGACANSPLAEVDWSQTPPTSGTVSEGAVIVVGPGTFPLTVIDGAAIPADADAYTLLVPVQYTDVQGEAYLEMWSVFANGERYFSRTLAQEGGMAIISGAGSRTAALPLDLGGFVPPESLELNVILPGGGTIELGAPTLVEGFTITGSATGDWWSTGAGGWIGAILGTTVGAFGWLLGRRASDRRKLRSSRTLATGGVAVGVVVLAAGLVALLGGQPYAVYYPLILAGGITVVVLGTLVFTFGRAIRDDELRQMKAADLVG